MPIPIQREIEIPLLHLINSLGGEVKPKDTYEPLADYFKLTEAEKEQMLPNAPTKKFENNVQWARMRLVYKGFIDNSIRGLWKITEKGKKELAKYGFLNKPFPALQKNYSRPEPITLLPEHDLPEHDLPEHDLPEHDLLDQVIKKLLPDGIKKFPGDFLDCKDKIEFREINVPGTILHLDHFSRQIVVSPKGYFRYKAKNPPEALYIIYSNCLGQRSIRIPNDNLIVFKAVKSYEKYIGDLESKFFERLLELTYDETKAENMTSQVLQKLNLKKV